MTLKSNIYIEGQIMSSWRWGGKPETRRSDKKGRDTGEETGNRTDILYPTFFPIVIDCRKIL